MDNPGLSGALGDPDMMAAADEKAKELLEDLKKEVKAEISEIGALRKELRVTVPAKVIADHMDHNYEELRQDAQVPGFRKGHAPRRLIEKRFGHDVRASLKTAIIGQSYFAAIENNELDVLGDPLFRVETDEGVKLVDIGEALQHVELPESEDYTYTCEVEIRPTFELPELTGIEIKMPVIAISDADVNSRVERLQKMYGRYEPKPEGAAEPDDELVVDLKLIVDGQEVKKEENASLSVRPMRVDGIALTDLGQALAGVKASETRSVDCTIPDDYERADLRGKTGQFSFLVHEIKRLTPMPIEQVIEHYGCESADQLRQFVREDLEAEKDNVIERAKHEQVYDYLLKNTEFDLPEKLSSRQIDRALARRVLEAQQSGIPVDEIKARLDELRTTTQEQVGRDLRLSFILEKIAEKLELEVTDEEVNSAIAQIARRYGRRFDRIRDELQKDGRLGDLAEQIRQDKCLAQLLRDAKVVEVEPEAKTTEKKKVKKAKKAEKTEESE
ncbi:MAG: trigger factor [Phycisphaerae bacterium]|nr:trigger factor [Phycisphaerae bacterium]